MIQNFQAYDLAVQLYQHCERLKAKSYFKDQLHRASLSIVLNLAEGSGKPTPQEQRRFHSIAFGSLRETQALLDLHGNPEAKAKAHRLGGMVYRLVNPKPAG